jgi:hypothetical protein
MLFRGRGRMGFGLGCSVVGRRFRVGWLLIIGDGGCGLKGMNALKKR